MQALDEQFVNEEGATTGEIVSKAPPHMSDSRHRLGSWDFPHVLFARVVRDLHLGLL